jgi:copper chaperone NosL
MASSGLQPSVRWVLLFCAAALIAVLFFPMWRIDLVAPQYPEGLVLLIYPHKLGGNVDIINGLNHYIGMKTMHTGDFFEFTILPYIIGFFALAFITVALAGRKKLLSLLFVLFISFGIIAMYDFWRWEYNYGHNLDPNAAIIVPGMAYQPPLIGFKQLLNFGAYSMPDVGGWIFVGVGLLLFSCVITQWRIARKTKNILKVPAATVIFSMVLFSCNVNPQPIKTGVDNCSFCKMTITDNRFGGELVTKKGKVFKFDDIHCLNEFKKLADEKDMAGIYLVDFSGTHDFIKAEAAFLLKAENVKSPMGSNTAAFKNEGELIAVKKQFNGQQLRWTDVSK